MKARDNPFRVERLHQLRFRPLEAPELIAARLKEMGFRGAIVGPHGTGKTTLLGEISGILRQQGRQVSALRLTEENRGDAARLAAQWMKQTSPQSVLLFDGAEQLTSRQWRAFEIESLSFAGLLITTHSPGRLPTVYQTETAISLLDELVRELAPHLTSSQSQLLPLLHTHYRGNLRDCLRELYDRWSD